jgi:hypothetical protein
MGEMINAYKILFRKSEGKRPHGRPRCGWEENIRMNLREMGWEGVEEEPYMPLNILWTF